MNTTLNYFASINKQPISTQKRFFTFSQIRITRAVTPKSFFSTQQVLPVPIQNNFLCQNTIIKNNLKGRTYVKIICECIQNFKVFEMLLIGSAFGTQAILYSTSTGYKGGIIQPYSILDNSGKVENFLENKNVTGVNIHCLSDRVIQCISAEVQFHGDFINGADSYVWPRIECDWVRLQEINPRCLSFEITKTRS